jgi:hypothetical protein
MRYFTFTVKFADTPNVFPQSGSLHCSVATIEGAPGGPGQQSQTEPDRHSAQ